VSGINIRTENALGHSDVSERASGSRFEACPQARAARATWAKWHYGS
jgi:hypothetical protein